MELCPGVILADEEIEEALFVGLQADLSVGLAGNRACESLVVHLKTEGRGGAEVGAERRR